MKQRQQTIIEKASIPHPHQPQRQFFPDGELHRVGQNVGIMKVGDLVEGFVLTTHLKCDAPVNTKITIRFSIFNRMIYRKLIDHKALPDGAYLSALAKGIEHVGIVKINLVRLLQTCHGFVVGIKQMQQFSPLQV